MRRYQVLNTYQTQFEDPLQLKAGDVLSIQPKQSEWPGWVWCLNEEGATGWVPERWLNINKRQAMIIRDYSATELSVTAGEIIQSDFGESGWVWARNQSGKAGWVPLNHLELAPAPTSSLPALSLIISRSCLVISIMLAGLFGALMFMTVPAPNKDNSVTVTGSVTHLSQPHPEYGDLTIILDQGREYYVNRANEVAYFNWQQLLEEVRPGDTLYLTVVRPLAWRLFSRAKAPTSGPVAGIRSTTTTYMNPAISAATWTSQKTFANVTMGTLVAVLFFLGLEIRRRYQRRGATNQNY